MRKPRRPWQNGHDNTGRGRFIMSAPMFIRRIGGRTATVRYPLHAWVEEATRGNRTSWSPSPERPQIFDCVNGKLRPMWKGDGPRLLRGNIVWMTFRIFFVLGSQNWWPDFVPIDIVRVGNMPGYMLGIHDDVVSFNAPQSLAQGTVEVTAGASWSTCIFWQAYYSNSCR